MKRYIGVAVVGLLSAALAQADLRPPDTRYIPLEHKIETDKEFPDHVFFTVHGNGEVKAVKLDPKNPVVIPGNAAIGRGPAPQPGEKRARPYRGTVLVAVPIEATKSYSDEKALNAALHKGEVKGAIESKVLHEYEAVKTNDPRKAVANRYRIVKIDAKEGIVLAAVKGEPKPEEESQSATTMRWLALGLALSAGVGFAGLWFTRRRNSSPPVATGGLERSNPQ